MKILVTGAGGFLGKFLCTALRERGEEVVEVHSKQCDLTKEGSLEQFSGVRFRQIYHLAAWTQAGDFCLYHPGEQWLINQKINTYVLTWWKERQPQAKMICMGTSCSYAPDMPLEEKNYLEGVPIESLFTYAMTKRMLLVGLMALQKQFGLEYLYLVPSTLYGPGYHTDGRQMHFIFDLIRKILRGKLYDEPVVLWGNGEQKRELVYVQDFIQILLELVDKEKNSVINIGAGEEYSIREFAQKICDHVSFPFKNIEFDLGKYVGAKSKVLSVDKLHALLPDYQMLPLGEGLKRTIDWFRENQETLLPPPEYATNV